MNVISYSQQCDRAFFIPYLTLSQLHSHQLNISIIYQLLCARMNEAISYNSSLFFCCKSVKRVCKLRKILGVENDSIDGTRAKNSCDAMRMEKTSCKIRRIRRWALLGQLMRANLDYGGNPNPSSRSPNGIAFHLEAGFWWEVFFNTRKNRAKEDLSWIVPELKVFSYVSYVAVLDLALFFF